MSNAAFEQQGTAHAAGEGLERLGFDLRSLQVFVAVVRCGAMTEAAAALGVTQSAVSQAVAGIERSLGVSLLDRSLRRLAPSPAGIALFERAEALLRDARETATVVRRADRGSLPLIRIAMIDSIASTAGPFLIEAMHRDATRWSIWAGLSDQHMRSLIQRAVDLVISLDSGEPRPEIVVHEVLLEPFVLALPPALARVVPSSLPELAWRLPLVRYSARSLTGKMVEQHLRRLRIEAPGRFSFDGSDALLAMVAAGLGWALTTPICALQAEVYARQIGFVPMPKPALRRRIIVGAHRGELGDLPATIAARLRQIVVERCTPRLRAVSPTLAEIFTALD